MPRPAPRHDHDAGGPAEVLAAKAAIRDEVWDAMRAAKVARFPGAIHWPDLTPEKIAAIPVLAHAFRGRKLLDGRKGVISDAFSSARHESSG